MRTKSLAGVLIALLMMAGATAASAQEVTQAEKDKALQYLETTKKNILEATRGLSEAQWNFKPAPERWSVAQWMTVPTPSSAAASPAPVARSPTAQSALASTGFGRRLSTRAPSPACRTTARPSVPVPPVMSNCTGRW